MIPTPSGDLTVTVASGTSAIFVGANGGGKTRLAVHIENTFQDQAHRISAHRSLSLQPSVAKISEPLALGGLRFGHVSPQFQSHQHRPSQRWGQNAATHLLNDYDFLIQALFADQANISLIAYHKHKPGSDENASEFKVTKLDQLVEIWDRLLPHRKLQITSDDISVLIPDGGTPYPASDMSDGERAIFYMIGQTLVAAENQLLIIDEPELHVHQSIMSKLWDELEAARPDCAFIYITHDLEFSAARSAQKFAIQEYLPTPVWAIETVPEITGFTEDLTTRILGSRRPILFVEGTDTSLDLAIYRGCYPDWTVVPRSSYNDVIHSVSTMRRNASFTRITCAGIVDGDDYDQVDRDKLNELGIEVLTVAEIENLLLLPSITAVVAEFEGHVGQEKDNRLTVLADAIFSTLDEPQKIERVVVDYCKRRIDRALKKVDLSAGGTLDELKEVYSTGTAQLNIDAIFDQRTDEIRAAIEAKDLAKLLEYYDNKGLLAIAATHLKNCRRADFVSWIVRSLRNNTCPALRENLSTVLPNITAQ